MDFPSRLPAVALIHINCTAPQQLPPRGAECVQQSRNLSEVDVRDPPTRLSGLGELREILHVEHARRSSLAARKALLLALFHNRRG